MAERAELANEADHLESYADDDDADDDADDDDASNVFNIVEEEDGP